MLSIQLIRESPDVVRRALRDRNTDAPIDRILVLDEQRRELIQKADALKAERNALSRAVGAAKPEDRGATMERSRSLSTEIDLLDATLREVETELNTLLLEVPNIPAPDVPVAPDESGNVVVRTEGEPRQLDFTPKPHWELGESLGIIDFERGVKLAGSRAFILRGAGARLQRALISFMLDLHTREHGYTELYPPFVLREENLYKSGHLPKFRDTMYHDAEEDFWFIPTAEASLANVHADEILDASALPIRYVACTACFRREKASAGRDVRGIKRVHQFDKVELFRFCLPEESEAHHQAMIGDAEDVLRRLGLHYRLLQLCTGDLDFKASKSFDLEIWAPGSEEWLEVSSASNCTDFQARRANIRFRRSTIGGARSLSEGHPRSVSGSGSRAESVSGSGSRARSVSGPGPGRVALEYPHMLNASGVALPRLLASVLETYQQPDGSVVLPGALAPYYGPDLVIRPPA